MIGREEEIKDYRQRALFANYFVLAAMLFIFGRLIYLQVIMGDKLRYYSEANRLKQEKLHAPRGIIFDRKGKVIVENRASFDVVLISQYYSFQPKENERLAKVLGISVEDLKKRLDKSKKNPVFHPTLLKADVSKDVIAGIEMGGFAGVNIEANVVRQYPYGDLGAPLLGYVGEVNVQDLTRFKMQGLQSGDYMGRAGLERKYDRTLRGIDGVGYVQVDARGRRRSPEKDEELLGFISQTDPSPGRSLHLTLDLDLQLAAEKSMKAKDYQGAVVAMDPRSGEILVLASMPAYDPASISGREVSAEVWKNLRESKDRPLRNRVIEDHYPPGSTFKLFIALAALSQGVATPKTTQTCNGGMRFGNRTFHCWRKEGHGTVDFVRAIKESCDVYFYKLGIDLGIDAIAKYARIFGFGARTGVELFGEEPGLIPDSAWKEKVLGVPWFPGETLSVAIGQGYVNSTPLQLAVSYAAIGNKGFVYRPYVVDRVENNGEILKKFRPELIRRVEIAPDIFDVVKQGLFEVVNKERGTAYWSARSPKVEISGKTGTAQVKRFKAHEIFTKCENLPRHERHHGHFVAYAPKDNPEIVVSTIGEHICHGHSAAKVVKEVIEAYFMGKELLPSEPSREITTTKETKS